MKKDFFKNIKNNIKEKYEKMPDAIKQKISSDILNWLLLFLGIVILLIVLKFYIGILYAFILLIIGCIYIIWSRYSAIQENEYEEVVGKIIDIRSRNGVVNKLNKQTSEVEMLTDEDKKIIFPVTHKIENALQKGEKYVFYFSKSYSIKNRKMQTNYKEIVTFTEFKEEDNEIEEEPVENNDDK